MTALLVVPGFLFYYGVIGEMVSLLSLATPYLADLLLLLWLQRARDANTGKTQDYGFLPKL
eukprot:scaffold3070_cov200-Ochromonas_danica.AAC.6